MTPEEAGNIILEIFQKESGKTGKVSALSNNVVHKEYFRRTTSSWDFLRASITSKNANGSPRPTGRRIPTK